MIDPIRIKMEAGQMVAEIDIFSFIGSYWSGLDAQTFKARLADAVKKAKTIRLNINSPGGQVYAGVAIYTMLKDTKARKEAYIYGLSASMSTIIQLAADKIYVAQGAQMMIHNPSVLAEGDAEDLRALADQLDSIKRDMIAIYAARSGKSPEEISAKMDATTWFSADEAVAFGLADEVWRPQAMEARFTASLGAAQPPTTTPDPTPDMKAIATALGLPETATEQEITAAIARKEADAAAKSAKDAQAKATLEALQTAGVITAENKATVEKMVAAGLSYTEISNMAAKPAVSLTEGMTSDNGGNGNDPRAAWTLKDWETKDPSGLEKMYASDRKRFDALAKARFPDYTPAS